VALEGLNSDLLQQIRSICSSQRIASIDSLIDEVINEDITYQKKPVEQRNQRTFAVRAGRNGMLDIARQTYTEANQDVINHMSELAGRMFPSGRFD
jgi:DNA mismatch repair protein MSH4